MSEMDAEKESVFYHERQKLQLCALHSLNNLFQQRRFNKQSLDTIVREYDKSWCWNEYSSLFTGNYDLTIILEALKREGYTLRAIDINESLNDFPFEDCLGLLLNKTLERPYFDRLPLIRSFTKPGRHWLVIKSLDGKNFYDLDSKLSRPQLIGDQTKLIEHLGKFEREATYMYMVIPEALAEKFDRR